MEEHHSIKENVEDYIEIKVQLIKLKMLDHAARGISGIITGIAGALLAIFILVFLSFSAAYAIAELSGRNSLGFLAIAVFYMILAAILFIFKEKLVTLPVLNSLAKKFYFKKEAEGN